MENPAAQSAAPASESPGSRNIRPIEDTVHTDFRHAMSYGSYLDLDRLLSSQHPVSKPEHHDELLFIIQHQTSELWLKLILHELLEARRLFDQDNLGKALKCIARVKAIQRTMTEQWSVLGTLTPREYAQFRGFLGNSSGFQSYQYRGVEFLLGNKNRGMLRVFESDPEAHALLSTLLSEPTLYDSFLAVLARAGYDIPADVLHRDTSEPWVFHKELVPVFQKIYESDDTPWGLYEACEDLVDVEDNFQAWRFRHLRTVQRTIGFKVGTGGSSGVDFLKRALDLTFFPELYAVRTEIGS
ncbi:tryptophan 2,3-dioxygenase [Arthrobacter sp. TES]|uniref:tryptophan 2,3-dioxygenase n=1 Tax=Paenarthrobacter TaxID=1742992 RepID=UPI000396F46F|nr:tryptophan 2,3-dioxygenase [Paenarthrobacter ureafaciens]AMB40530.1 tryptophan 2,3-dioxygenase [Arthrobacter sp. ATCC 21022]AOY71467.1 tryptophan 2,3-dioxygenase [Arthrobacter sp. ZXY-2]QOI63322.1 tryptophan 2,3-dioxygenase [Arthrobacter sp. TES]BCW84323.1 tryptophan 2,3-dioxygenase [Arthrobacter sp. NicSoilE8]MBN9131176.1 tryptophan 2,3-dioxygenase [Paenarthrobacter ureafaciens]